MFYEHKFVTNYLLLSKISHKLYQFNNISITITSFYLHNYGQLGDFILLGGSLASLKQSFVQLRHMIATITDT